MPTAASYATPEVLRMSAVFGRRVHVAVNVIRSYDVAIQQLDAPPQKPVEPLAEIKWLILHGVRRRSAARARTTTTTTRFLLDCNYWFDPLTNRHLQLL